LHQALKDAATRNCRSLNGEIVARLEGSFGRTVVDVDAVLARIRERSARAPIAGLDGDELRALKEGGRR
jgi:hypothetical protein